MVIPITYLHTAFVKTCCYLNAPFITEGSGGSDARAKAANISIIKLIQNN
jgi:hypothetical protein